MPITVGLSQWRNRDDILSHYFAQSTTVTDGRTELRQRNEQISHLAKLRAVKKITRVDKIQNYYNSCRQRLNNFDWQKMSGKQVMNKIGTITTARLTPQSINSLWMTASNVVTLNTKFGQLILRKIIKIDATRCQILRLKCTKYILWYASSRLKL